jgi:hypothetical protein
LGDKFRGNPNLKGTQNRFSALCLASTGSSLTLLPSGVHLGNKLQNILPRSRKLLECLLQLFFTNLLLGWLLAIVGGHRHRSTVASHVSEHTVRTVRPDPVFILPLFTYVLYLRLWYYIRAQSTKYYSGRGAYAKLFDELMVDVDLDLIVVLLIPDLKHLIQFVETLILGWLFRKAKVAVPHHAFHDALGIRPLPSDRVDYHRVRVTTTLRSNAILMVSVENEVFLVVARYTDVST